MSYKTGLFSTVPLQVVYLLHCFFWGIQQAPQQKLISQHTIYTNTYSYQTNNESQYLIYRFSRQILFCHLLAKLQHYHRDLLLWQPEILRLCLAKLDYPDQLSLLYQTEPYPRFPLSGLFSLSEIKRRRSSAIRCTRCTVELILYSHLECNNFYS